MSDAMRLVIDPWGEPPARKIAKVVEILHGGGVAAYPTDSVYALGCAIEAKDAEIVRLNDLRISEAKAAGASLVKLAKASKGAIRRLGRAMGDEGDDDDDDDAGEDMGDKRTPPA